MESREEKSFQDKTEEATDEKRNQFREEGNVVVLKKWCQLLH